MNASLHRNQIEIIFTWTSLQEELALHQGLFKTFNQAFNQRQWNVKDTTLKNINIGFHLIHMWNYICNVHLINSILLLSQQYATLGRM
jgi:hypothetical protein